MSGLQTTGATVSPPAAPVSTLHQPAARPTAAGGGEASRASLPAARPTAAGVADASRASRPAAPTAAGVADASRASRPAAPTAAELSVPAPLPSRRTLRQPPRTTSPADLGRAASRALSAPVRTIGSAFASAKAVPLTATAVVACLFVTVATPQTAHASTSSVFSAASNLGRAAQHFTATGAPAIAVERDAFGIGSSGRPAPAAPGQAAALADPDEHAVRPVSGTIPAAGGFGSRWVSGCGACSTNHQGLDFAAPPGTAVVAVMSGRVEAAGVSGGYGNQVLLRHPDGTQTRYGHLSRVDVRAGQTVTAGGRIGAVGSTGVSTGSHLHFEVILRGGPVDPAAWLRARGLL
ncbi:M23 family metallopeptidase [Curtobacterium pusillum]|uniref:M23 family metallopeptidase n=1 Tax=Curtobacterium pusillum TaxID=69373 RepID=UPI0021B609B1|nr:peptidoglycan DD-metalloendopeptidase family protein [Curtobacterium pusillum]